MKRILFLVLWFIPIIQGPCSGAIEIYANGHKYASLQEYHSAQQLAVPQTHPEPASLNGQQEDYVRQEARRWGINVDLGKVKTFQVGHAKLSDSTRHKLYVLSVENGMVGALQDFYQAWGQSEPQMARTITPEQLQEVLEDSVTKSKDPKLLITEPGKVRIMTLTQQSLKN